MNFQTPIKPGSELAAEFWEKGRSDACPIYNMHSHMGRFHSMYMPRCEAADMVHSMDAAGVKLACVAHGASLHAPDIGNRLVVEAVREFPDRFRAYVTVNPNYLEDAERDLSQFDEMPDVYVGLKFHPDSHKVKLTDERYRAALEFADERGAPVLSHTYDGSSFNDADQVRGVLEKYSNLRFLLGHSLKSNWHAAAAIAREFPNTYLELTGVLGQWGAVDVLCEEAGSERLLFGTDLPWYGQHQGIGHLLSADITDEDVHNICHRNAEKLLDL